MALEDSPHSLFQTQSGVAEPLGVSAVNDGFNFALFSDHASSVTLYLYTKDSDQPSTFALEKSETPLGNIWHIWVSGITEDTTFLYQIDGISEPENGLFFLPESLFIDPYTKCFESSRTWGHIIDASKFPIKSRVMHAKNFDWEGVSSPQIPKEDLIIYEMHVRGFTQDPDSKVSHRGTYLGIIEKIPYLKSLGINAIELMPIFEFDENSNTRVNPTNDVKLYNYWGYTPSNFFTPMRRYASGDGKCSAILEFKTLVKELHKNGIEVILDVVYNHVLSTRTEGPYPCFYGIDNPVYYLLSHGHPTNYTGCGNTINCNHKAVRKLIIDSLVYWVQEMHVDGFRFDLASILTRGEDGKPMENPTILKEIREHPLLAKTKWIMEPWDAAGLFQLGKFPQWGSFSEWNGFYRDTLRRFIKGDSHQAANFAQAITGSPHLYQASGSPSSSINFITAHDGFTLHDLVSYEKKHNLENGENNKDGCNNNDSWNCGKEGTSSDRHIEKLREQQMQNFYLALFISRGVPMIFMGDEYGHSKKGNNNTWCLDNEKNWFSWKNLEKFEKRFHFLASLIRLRKKETIFRKNAFYSEEEISWHGLKPGDVNWEDDRRYGAFIIRGQNSRYYCAFNATNQTLTFEIPKIDGAKWYRIIDTSIDAPENFIEDPKGRIAIESNYEVAAYSSILLQTK